jgi:hypothetical protein
MKIKNEYFSELEIDCQERVAIIYGSNGTGKTTISKEFEKNENTFVFNENFVRKNVFISNRDGIADVTSEDKKERSKLFISNNCIEINNMIQDLEENKNLDIKKVFTFSIENDAKREKLYNSIESEHNKTLKVKIEGLTKAYTNSKITDFKDRGNKDLDYIKIDELVKNEINNCTNNNILDIDNYINDFEVEEFEKFLDEWSSKNDFGFFDKLYVEYQNTRDLAFSEIGTYLVELTECIKGDKTVREHIRKIATIVNSKVNITEETNKYLDNENNLINIKKWIDVGSELHNGMANFCFYCEDSCKNKELHILKEISAISKSTIINIKTKIKSEITKIKTDLIATKSKVETINEEKIDLIKGNDTYSNRFAHLLQYIQVDLNLLEKIQRAFDDANSESDEKVLTTKINNLVTDSSRGNFLCIKKEEENEMVRNNIDLIMKDYIVHNYDDIKTSTNNNVIKNIVETSIKWLKELLSDATTEISNKVNNKWNEYNALNLSNSYDIKLDFHVSDARMSGKDKYQLDFIGADGKPKSLNEVSAGQRMMIAFIFFLVRVDEQLASNKDLNIVIDDPVDGMDFYSNIMITVILNDILKKSETCKLLILSHSFKFINSLLFAFKDKKLSLQKLTYQKRLLKLERNEILNSDNSLFIKLVNFVIDHHQENDEITNSYYLLSIFILFTKLVDNTLYSIYEGYFGKSPEPSDNLYENMKDNIENLKVKNNIKDNVEVSEFLEYYKSARHKTDYAILSSERDDDNFIKINLIWDDFKELSKQFVAISNDKLLSSTLQKLFSTKIKFSESLEKYLKFGDVKNTDYALNQILKATKIMLFAKIISKEKARQLKYEPTTRISNTLRHSSFSLSDPLISFDYDEIIDQINYDDNGKPIVN